MSYTIKFTSRTNHIAGIAERTVSRESRDESVVGYYALSACSALSREGVWLTVGKTFADLRDALRAAELGERTLCKTCRKAAEAELAADDADQAPADAEPADGQSGNVESADGELWGNQQIADYRGTDIASVRKWVQRKAISIAGYRIAESGRAEAVRRAADVIAAHTSSPGKGNRTPRKPKPLVVDVTVSLPGVVWDFLGDGSGFCDDEPETWRRMRETCKTVRRGKGYAVEITAPKPGVHELGLYLASVADLYGSMSAEERGSDGAALARGCTVAAERIDQASSLPGHFVEVLDYLVDRTAADPDAYCWAVGKGGLYGTEYGQSEPVRVAGTFLSSTLVAMERRGFVRRERRHESMVAGPSTKYTVAYITDAGREALAAVRAESKPRR